jgi:hypothetical protein
MPVVYYTTSLRGAVLAAADADAKAAGLNRSETIEQALRNEHPRTTLENSTARTVHSAQYRRLREQGLPGESSRWSVIAPADIVPRRDTGHELYVVVRSQVFDTI